MRIAVYASDRYGSSHHRAYEPMRALARRGHAVWVNTYDIASPPNLASYDVAYIQRYQDAGAQELARRMRAGGLAVVWDHDDAIEANPERKQGAMKSQRTSAGIKAMVGLSDVVTTTNEALAVRFRELGAASVRIVGNYLGDHFRNIRRPHHEGLVLGWAAWADHERDWRGLGLHATLCRLLKAHPHVRVESVGPIDLGLPRDRYLNHGAVPFTEIGQVMARFDVGIAPIADTPFNRARSDVKLKEYAATGVVWLASPVGPYAAMEEKQGGRLVADDRWYEELERLVTNDRLRRRLARRGARWATDQMLAGHVAAWEAPLAEAVERAAGLRRTHSLS